MILQNGRPRCPVMLQIAREIWWLAYEHNVQFRVSHIIGRLNVVADMLSRLHLGGHYLTKYNTLKQELQPELVEVTDLHFNLQYSKEFWAELKRGAGRL